MKKVSISLIFAGLMAVPSISSANDYSTVARVHYVQDCIALNEGTMNVYEASHKCSCVVDELAKVFTQIEFEDINTGFRFKNLPGDRGGVFRDDEDISSGIGLFKKTHIDAYETCRIRR